MLESAERIWGQGLCPIGIGVLVRHRVDIEFVEDIVPRDLGEAVSSTPASLGSSSGF